MTEDLTFGEYTRRLRRAKHWQVQELAIKAGLSLTHVSRIENDNAVPNSGTVVKLANALGGDLDLMLKLSDCLPDEILDRLMQNSDASRPKLQRSARAWADPTFARDMVEDIDPALKSALARLVGAQEDDVDSIITLLREMALMNADQKAAIVDLVKAFALEKRE